MRCKIMENLSNEVSRGFRTPEESKEFPGYYVVPNHPDVLVNGVGEAISAINGEPLGRKCNSNGKRGYSTVQTFDEKAGRKKSVAVHRLVALTFLKRECSTHVVVNHKDGDKFNNSPFNLEWCTWGYNSHHAYQNGLRDDNRAIIRHDLVDGSTREWVTLNAAARDNGVGQENIHRWVNGEPKIRFGRYVFRYLSEKLTKTELARVDRVESTSHLGIEVVAINACSGSITIYPSVASAARAHNVLPATVRDICRYGRKHAINGHAFSFIGNKDALPTVSEIADATVKCSNDVVALDLSNGTEIVRPNCIALGAAIGVQPGTLSASLRRDNFYPINGYLVKKLLDDREWPSLEELSTYTRGRARPVVALSVKTQRRHDFDSVNEAAERLKISKYQIATNARKRRDCDLKGYVFRYTDELEKYPFPEIDLEYITKARTGKPLTLKVKDYVTGQEFCNLDTSQASTICGAKRPSITAARINSRLVRSRWLVRVQNDYRPWPTIEELIKYRDAYSITYAYSVTADDSGNRTLYLRLEDVAAAVNMELKRLRDALSQHDGVYRVNGLTVKATKWVFSEEANVTGTAVA
jgi:hypothetical protein